MSEPDGNRPVTPLFASAFLHKPDLPFTEDRDMVSLSSISTVKSTKGRLRPEPRYETYLYFKET